MKFTTVYTFILFFENNSIINRRVLFTAVQVLKKIGNADFIHSCCDNTYGEYTTYCVMLSYVCKVIIVNTFQVI